MIESLQTLKKINEENETVFDIYYMQKQIKEDLNCKNYILNT